MSSSSIPSELRVWLLLSVVPLLYGVALVPIALVWVLYCARFIYRQIMHVEWLSGKSKIVYITGCDSGFGLSSALALYGRGCTVVAGCLDLASDGARKLLKIEANDPEDRMMVLKLDIADPADVAQCASKIEKLCEQKGLPGLWALYNNAGIALAGEIELMPMADFERGIQVNLLGPIRVTKSVLHLIRPAKGRIVTVASGIGQHGLAGRAGYCVPKAGVTMFNDILRYEMQKFGVKVSLIWPGNFTAASQVFARLHAYVDGMAGRLDKKVVDDYGVDYFEKWRKACLGPYQAASESKAAGNAGDGLQPVVDSIVQAVLSRHPRARYVVAQTNFLVWWFFADFLPYEILDWFHARWNRHLPSPACLAVKR